jgi:hypothetical protein
MIAKTIFILLIFVSLANSQARWPDNQFDNQITPFQRANSTSCSQTTPFFSDSSVGSLHPGMSLAQLELSCHNLRYGWFGGDEGIFSPVALAKLGSGSLLIEFEDTLSTSRIQRLLIGTPEIRSREGLGVGSQVRDLVTAWGRPSRAEIECLLYVYFESKPGLSFQVDLPIQVDCGKRDSVEQSIFYQSKVHQVIIGAKR